MYIRYLGYTSIDNIVNCVVHVPRANEKDITHNVV